MVVKLNGDAIPSHRGVFFTSQPKNVVGVARPDAIPQPF
jgi:hypothetical protein